MSIRVGIPAELGVSDSDIRNFYRENWNRPIPLTDEKFYQWQFCDTPSGVNQCCIALSPVNEIIGVMGVNFRPFHGKGVPRVGGELTTWVVRSDFKNRGVAPKMIEFLQERYEVLIGMGISEAALPIYLRHGFRYRRAIPRFVKVLNWSAVSGCVDVNPMAKKVDAFWKKNSKRDDYLHFEYTDEKLTLALNGFTKSAELFDRSKDYLAWRYTNHPYFDYKIGMVSYPNTDGLAFYAYRIDDVPAGIRVLHLVDLFGEPQSVIAAEKYISDVAADNNVDVIDFYTTYSSMHGVFLSKGWFSSLDDYYFNFPHLFHPLELRDPTSTSLIMWAKDPDCLYFDISRMHVTKQDADFDRPSGALVS